MMRFVLALVLALVAFPTIAQFSGPVPYSAVGSCFTVSATGVVSSTTNIFAKSADYTVNASESDMCNGLSLTGSHTLTIPAISSTVFPAGAVMSYTNGGSGDWTISSTPAIVNIPSLTLFPGASGTLISDGTSLYCFSCVSGSAETLTVSNPGTQTTGTPMTVSGTYTNGTPTAMDTRFDSGSWSLVSSPTISGGTYSFSVTAPAAGTHTVSVRDSLRIYVNATSPSFTVTAGYSGEGDAVASATAWYSLATAYNQAFATPGTNVSSLLTRNDAHTCKTLIASGGTIGNTTQCNNGGDDGTALATWLSGHTAVVTTLYDQTGNGHDLTGQNSPAVALSVANGLPCIHLTHASSMYLSNASYPTTSQPTSLTGVAESVSNNNGTVIGTNTGAAQVIGFDASADNQAFVYAGTTLASAAAANDNVMHGLIAVANGGSSVIQVDNNVATTGAAGPNGTTSGIGVGANPDGTFSLDGYLCSAGIWNTTTFSSGNRTAINAVQATNFGIP